MGNQHGKEKRSYGRKIDWENAERPLPPGKPYLAPDNEEQSEFITIRWAPPVSDGGAPILGYVVEHRKTGSPHWLRAVPYLPVEEKLTLTGLEPGWRYQFRVSAENDIGRSQPGEISEVLTVTSQRTAATAPHFNVELQDTVALENEKVEFTVHVVAVPQAKITWYKDGFEVFSSRRMKIITENDQSTFIIHQAALEDEGEIKCTATNKAGHSVTKAILKLEAPPRVRLPRQYEDGLLFEKGELIRLKVSTAGRPSPTVTWYHNGELIQNNDKYEIIEAERSSALRINEAKREDRGEYEIRAFNKIGEDIVSFLVTVTDRPSPPGKTDITVIDGRSVTLTWTSPEDDGGCKIGNYIVEYFRVGWNMWLKAATCRQLTTVLNDLIEASEYKFRVKAENPYGVSEPSEESCVIFIPDPKRGILTAPEKNSSSGIDLWLNSGEQKNVDKSLDLNEKRTALEENARRLLDMPLPGFSSQEKTMVKSSRKTEIISVSEMPEGKKRSFENSENTPPPVPKRKHKADKKTSTPSPNQKMEIDQFEKDLKNSKEVIEDREEETVPSLREKDDAMFHGSSELMLVLLPDDPVKSAEMKTGQQREDIEIALIGPGVAPPMSLSAPELGSDGPIEYPPMRDAVSSTELLHERVTTRLYQDAMDEEAQKLLKRRFSGERKSVERKSSLRESTFVERRHSFKDNTQIHLSEIDRDVPETRDDSSIKTGNEVEETFMRKISYGKDEPKVREKRMSSVEREEMEFALVRERIRIKNEQNKELRSLPSLPPTETQNNASSSVNQVTSCGEDEKMNVEKETEDEEDEGEEEEEEEEEEDYLEDENYDEEEEEEEEEEIRHVKMDTSDLTPPVPKHKAPFAEEEPDYAPPLPPITSRIILPRLEITLPPTIQEVTEEKLPSPVRQQGPEIESTELKPHVVSVTSVRKEEKRTSKFLKKLGLKKEKKIPEIVFETDASAPGSPLLKPILKKKPKKKDKEAKKAEEVAERKSPRWNDSTVEKFFRKKKQVRIAEPNEATGNRYEAEEEQETKVLIYHYSDIVREFGQGKRPPTKQYLNCEELKAIAAEEGLNRSPTSESLASVDKEEEEPPAETSRPDTPIAPSSSTESVPREEPSKRLDESTNEKEQEAPVTETPAKVKNSIDYLTDVAMFLVACWLYLFENELYAVPILCLMAYRQMNEALAETCSNLKKSFSKRFSRQKDEN